MTDETSKAGSKATSSLPTPPSGGTIKTTLEWLEAQNKAETKERRNALRSQIEKGIFNFLEAAITPQFAAVDSRQRVTWNLLIQQHIGAIALVAGSPYKLIKVNAEDKELTPRVKVLEIKLQLLAKEYASWLGVSDLPFSLHGLADRIDLAFKEDRSLRNAILQRSHSITKVNNFVLKSGDEELLSRKMTTYYKTISQFIDSTSRSYEESHKNNTVAQANARRHATEWAAFAQKYLIDSLKLRAERGEKLLFKAAQSRYEREITQRLMAGDSATAIVATEAVSKVAPSKRADFVLSNGVEVDFKALGSKGFVATATLPSKLKSKPFRVMAEIQQLAERESRLPEMNLSFVGNPPSGLEISIGANSNADVYELFAEFVVKSLSTIK
jgi:hypothetical protein